MLQHAFVKFDTKPLRDAFKALRKAGFKALMSVEDMEEKKCVYIPPTQVQIFKEEGRGYISFDMDMSYEQIGEVLDALGKHLWYRWNCRKSNAIEVIHKERDNGKS